MHTSDTHAIERKPNIPSLHCLAHFDPEVEYDVYLYLTTTPRAGKDCPHPRVRLHSHKKDFSYGNQMACVPQRKGTLPPGRHSKFSVVILPAQLRLAFAM